MLLATGKGYSSSVRGMSVSVSTLPSSNVHHHGLKNKPKIHISLEMILKWWSESQGHSSAHSVGPGGTCDLAEISLHCVNTLVGVSALPLSNYTIPHDSVL